MKTLQSLFIMLFLFGALLVARSASAQDATPRPVTADDVNRIAKKLFCPVCENVPLDVCPTQACAQWRATIREKLAAGWSEPQILDYFVAQYGERVLAQPSTRGPTVLVWIIPPLALVAGAFVLWRFLRQVARPAPATLAATPTPPDPADEYAARLEQELQERR
ncbi:MAG: ccmH [Anaerolineales bacterium]|jgi:cytochrome c-type biogenesis protein CcmH|nr:ccmH [Anaerolineales bacterium]